jgi:Protein of unknown function (DUF3613)
MNTIIRTLLLGSALGAGVVQAQSATERPLGSQTRQWVQLQQDPKAQSGEARPMPGEIADEVYKRYVNSFKYPIPEQFKRQPGASGSGSSGGSGDATAAH